MNAFLTGSHVYGTPHEKSDIDLVVMMTSGTLEAIGKILDLAANSESQIQYDGSSATACLRFGDLNLLVVTRLEDYEAWRDGTNELAWRKPVTRDEAVAVFQAKREAAKAKREGETAIEVSEIEEVAF